MSTIDYTVTRVPVERTFALRKAVLRPYLAEDEPYSCPDDHLPETVALAAVTPDDEVIGVARISPEPPPFQRGGMQRWGEVWEDPDIGPHVVMWRGIAEPHG